MSSFVTLTPGLRWRLSLGYCIAPLQAGWEIEKAVAQTADQVFKSGVFGFIQF
jgi:hypothetical protein